MNFLKNFSAAPADPIFQIAQEAAIAGKDVINATVGVIGDDTGGVLVLPSVRKAATEIAKNFSQRTFGYPPVLGLPGYRSVVLKLMGLDAKATPSIATTGGTGAVAVNLRLLQRIVPQISVILPVPTWPIHRQLLEDAHVPFIEVDYLKDDAPSLDAISDAISHASGLVAVLVQASCHNPTGLDFSSSQWEELATVLSKKSALVLLDMAYQGLAGEPSHDAQPLHILRKNNIATFVSWSASKNHTIYGLRTGLACTVVDASFEKDLIEGHYVSIIRGIHSAASVIGQEMVTVVQEKFGSEWRDDLQSVRSRLMSARAFLSERLPRFNQALSGCGMFAQLPLSAGQVERLKQGRVFLAPGGRINIAGIPGAKLEEFARALSAVDR